MLEDAAVILGLLVTAYLIQHFQEVWVSNEYEAAIFLKVNDGKALGVFSLAFLGSIFIFAGTVFTALEMDSLNAAMFNMGLLLYMAFFLLLNNVSRGGEHFWERG